MVGESQYMSCFDAQTIRDIVREVNNRNIPREKLVDILYDSDRYYVLYYK